MLQLKMLTLKLLKATKNTQVFLRNLNKQKLKKKKNAIEIAKNMIKRQKYSEEEIAENTNLPLDKVKKIIEEMKE